MTTADRDRDRGRERRRFVRRPTTDHGLTALLGLLVFLIFVIQPLAEIGVVGRFVTSIFFSLMLVAGVWAVGGRRGPALILGALVSIALAVRWGALYFGHGPLILASILAEVFCISVVVIVLTEVFRGGRVTFHRIRGAVAAYLLLGLTFAFAYEMITLKWPDAFTFANARPTMPDALISHFVYFSFVTLTTLGYGDVTPNHPIARSLVTVEALIGQLFPAILLARLVSLELLHEERRAAEEIRR
ncbi:MAG: hypothetical protein E6J72_08700 [Deltaproteobacteria bacterium]|nr:MAG: hypothetical protein E6J72_08700 [Deltaproteobacteria bacterium]